MWELSWYRYEVDLSDEAGGVRKEGQGAELSELAGRGAEANAAADERGGLHLAVKEPGAVTAPGNRRMTDCGPSTTPVH